VIEPGQTRALSFSDPGRGRRLYHPPIPHSQALTAADRRWRRGGGVHACACAPRLKVYVYGKAVEAGRVGRRPLRCTQAAKVTSRRGPRPAVNDTSRLREGDGVTARRIAARPWVVRPSTGAVGRNLPRFPSLWVPHVADTRTDVSKDSIKHSIGPGTRLFPRGPPPAHCRVSGIPRTGDPDSRIFILGGPFRLLTRTCRSTVGRRASTCTAHAN